MLVPSTEVPEPPYRRPTLDPPLSLPYDRQFDSGTHHPAIDPQGNVYSAGLGDLAGFGGTLARKAVALRASAQPPILQRARLTSQSSLARAKMGTALKKPAARAAPTAAMNIARAKQAAAYAAKNSWGASVSGLGDLGELAGATGIPAVDGVIADFGQKASRIETALKISTAASAAAALAGLVMIWKRL